MLPPTDAQAKAGKAVAETTGTIPQDLLGLAGGDWLHEERQRNLAQMQAKTARILEGVDQQAV